MFGWMLSKLFVDYTETVKLGLGDPWFNPHLLNSSQPISCLRSLSIWVLWALRASFCHTCCAVGPWNSSGVFVKSINHLKWIKVLQSMLSFEANTFDGGHSCMLDLPSLFIIWSHALLVKLPVRDTHNRWTFLQPCRLNFPFVTLPNSTIKIPLRTGLVCCCCVCVKTLFVSVPSFVRTSCLTARHVDVQRRARALALLMWDGKHSACCCLTED